jgi:hypothetical protein
MNLEGLDYFELRLGNLWRTVTFVVAATTVRDTHGMTGDSSSHVSFRREHR